MPRDIAEGFRDFLAKLIPSEIDSAAAQSHRASISARLDRDFGLRRFVRIGSFGNGTSISGYSDVDYLASLNRDTLTQNSTYSLQKIRTSLDERFPHTGVHVDCPAVVVPFGTVKSETTEIVPGDYIEELSGYKVYDIADCQGGWMRASPDAHLDYVRTVNKKLDERVKPLIRFLKAWKFFKAVPISSFYLEMRVAKYASNEASIVYDIDVKNVLSALWDNQLASMQDPMGVAGLVPACKSEAGRQEALSKLETAMTRAKKARAATANGEIPEAFEWWRLLYSERFPTYYY